MVTSPSEPLPGSVVDDYEEFRSKRGTEGPLQSHQRSVSERLLVRDKAVLDRKTPNGDYGLTKGHMVTMVEFADAPVSPDSRIFVGAYPLFSRQLFIGNPRERLCQSVHLFH